MQINAGSVASAVAWASLINMAAIKCTYKQLQHVMQVRFQQLCVLHPGKFKKEGLGASKGNSNGNKMPLGHVEFKGTC